MWYSVITAENWSQGKTVVFTAGKFYSVGDGKFVFRSLEVIWFGLLWFFVMCFGFFICLLLNLFKTV